MRSKTGRKLTDKQMDHFLRYHITENKDFSPEMRKKLDDRSLFLFSNNKAKEMHNIFKLTQVCSKQNPCAKMVSIKSGRHCKCREQCWHDDNRPNKAFFCVGSVVMIKGCNFHPRWGLYNGSMGTVKDIVYEKDQSPHVAGCLPSYVLVDFPHYCGPPLFGNKERRQYVPIPVLSAMCSSTYGTMQYVLLKVSYGRTVHTAQGMSIGPVNEGQAPNLFLRCIIDPGSVSTEARNPGLFYVAASRATTMGDPDDIVSSAIYYFGDNMTRERMKSINRQPKARKRDQNYQSKLDKRKNWVNYLKRHEWMMTDRDRRRMERVGRRAEKSKVHP